MADGGSTVGEWERLESGDGLDEFRRAVAMAMTLQRFYADALSEAEDELAEVLGRVIEAREALEAITEVLVQRMREYDDAQCL